MHSPWSRLFGPLLSGTLALAAPAAGAAEVHAAYRIYAMGVPIAELQADFASGARDYRIDLAFRTTGLVGAMFQGRQTSTVQGLWDGNRPDPVRFQGDGYWRGQPRRIAIEYRDGRPIIRSLIPPNDEEREPVPPSLQVHAVDTLSALALLIRRVTQGGRCDAAVTTFDGRRAVDLAAHTSGEEVLAPSGRSVFSGRALRCDFEGRLLAGALREGDQAEARRPKHGSAWLAEVVPGAPPVPVRIQFETSSLGTATMYLTDAGPGPLPVSER